jgi:hypothetical protein
MFSPIERSDGEWRTETPRGGSAPVAGPPKFGPRNVAVRPDEVDEDPTISKEERIMNRSIALATVAFALIAGPAAAVIGPVKPSQVVVLRVSGQGTACQGGGGQEADLQVHPDGTIDPYVPPPGYGFVITGIDWGSAGNPANAYTPVAIRLVGAQSGVVFVTGALADAGGTSWGSAVVPNVAVAPGTAICVGVPGKTQVAVHGYYTVYK